jgi:predicted amidophosphoribosyltransferase
MGLGAAVALDDRMRCDHSHLTAADQCWYLARYVSGPGYRAGEVNQLIANLKCAPSVAAINPARRAHKRRAIDLAAAALRRAVSRARAESATWIPIPPSCAPGDRDYDDRLMRILRTAFAGYDADLRHALYQLRSQPADHSRPQRLSIQTLYDSIRVNGPALEGRFLRTRIVLFDDVLTSGKHYRCCEQRLREALAGVAIEGLFLARRVLSARGRCISGLMGEYDGASARPLVGDQQCDRGGNDAG